MPIPGGRRRKPGAPAQGRAPYASILPQAPAANISPARQETMHFPEMNRARAARVPINTGGGD